MEVLKHGRLCRHCQWVLLLISRQFSSRISQKDGRWRVIEKHQDAGVFMKTLDKHYLEKKKTVEVIIEHLKEIGELVPDNLTASDWQYLLKSCQSYREYKLHLRHIYRKRQSVKSSEDNLDAVDHTNVTHEAQIVGATHEKKLNQFYLSKYIQGFNSGNRVIIDLNFDSCDTNPLKLFKECLNISKVNIYNRQPLHLNFTGFRRNLALYELCQSESVFLNNTGDWYEEDFPSLFHPRKSLVYLSQDGKPMQDYTGDEIFVIGGLTDRSRNKGLSFGKAEELGIRCVSFPIPKYFTFHHRRLLTLQMTDVVSVLLDLSLGFTWQESLSRNLNPVNFKLKVGKEQEVFTISV